MTLRLVLLLFGRDITKQPLFNVLHRVHEHFDVDVLPQDNHTCFWVQTSWLTGTIPCGVLPVPMFSLSRHELLGVLRFPPTTHSLAD